MPFEKGKPRPPNAGRKKGVPNKITRTVREAWVEAFELVNERIPLHEWGAANPEKFYPLATKLIPIDVTSGDKPIAPSAVNIVLIDSDASTAE
jgi:hypothetical protein